MRGGPLPERPRAHRRTQSANIRSQKTETSLPVIPNRWHPRNPINNRATTIDRYEGAGLTALIYLAAGKKMRKGEPTGELT